MYVVKLVVSVFLVLVTGTVVMLVTTVALVSVTGTVFVVEPVVMVVDVTVPYLLAYTFLGVRIDSHLGTWWW